MNKVPMKEIIEMMRSEEVEKMNEKIKLMKDNLLRHVPLDGIRERMGKIAE